jgi:hypothetical protein
LYRKWNALTDNKIIDDPECNRLKKYNLGDDEVGFNWKQVKAGVEGWEGWDHYYLQRRWKSLRQYMRKKHQKNWGKNRGSEGASGPPRKSYLGVLFLYWRFHVQNVC